MNILQKWDVILAAAILLLTAAVLGTSHCIRCTSAVIAQMSAGGTAVEIPDLSRDTETTVTSSNGDTNRLIVKDCEIWCSEAGCPDKVCVHQGKKRLNSDTIVCPPNQMIVAITGGEQTPRLFYLFLPSML